MNIEKLAREYIDEIDDLKLFKFHNEGILMDDKRTIAFDKAVKKREKRIEVLKNKILNL